MSDLKIGGLSSGLDVESIVSELMDVEQIKIDNVDKDKQYSNWKIDSYQEMNRTLANFVINTKSELNLSKSLGSTVLNSSSANISWAKEASVGDGTVISAQAGRNAVSGSYTVTVNSLASAWSAASKTELAESADSLKEQFSLAEGDSLNFTIETAEGSVTVTENDLSSVSLKDIAADINAADIGVSASYDTDNNRFFLFTDATGSENTVTITDSSSLTGRDGFLTGANSLLGMQYENGAGSFASLVSGETYSGTDASVDFGAAENIVSSGNSIIIQGISMTVHSLGETTLSVGADIDAIYEKVEAFVESYNELVDTLSTKITEERDYDYEPLTDAEKEEMSENDIETWEEAAKSGILGNDSYISKVLSDIRGEIYSQKTDAEEGFQYLFEIGITTQRYSGVAGSGKMEIDENLLRSKIAENPDAVLDLLFEDVPSGTDGLDSNLTSAQLESKYEESGFVNRVYSRVANGISSLLSQAGTGSDSTLYSSVQSGLIVKFITSQSGISYLEQSVADYEEKIDDMWDVYDQVETRYWAQFTALETALSNMNAQSSWLSAQVEGLS